MSHRQSIRQEIHDMMRELIQDQRAQIKKLREDQALQLELVGKLAYELARMKTKNGNANRQANHQMARPA